MTSTPFHQPFGGLQYDETRQKPGVYLATIAEVKAGRSKAGNPMPRVAFKCHTTGYVYPRFCPLSPEGTKDAASDLEKLNGIFRAVGHKELTRGQILAGEIDVERLLGCSVVLALDTEYRSSLKRYRSIITAVRPLSEFRIRLSTLDPFMADVTESAEVIG